MKQILVPTDFSTIADNASRAALRLGKIFQAKIVWYHCTGLPERSNSLSENQQLLKPDLYNSAEQIQKMLEVRSSWAEKQGLESTVVVSGGSLIENLKNIVDTHACDFVVMGSHGVSGENKYIIGSNTQKALRMLHRSVLIVKEPIDGVVFDKVIFASNFDQKEQVVFEYFLEFIKPFNPEIHLLAINTGGFFSQPAIIMHSAMERFERQAKPLKFTSHFYRDFNVDHGIRQFVEEIGADLVGISNVSRRPLRRVFLGSNVEALVNHAIVPVLSIDFASQ